MERIGVRELRQHASRYLDLVKAGATVEVTERGQLVARLVPVSAPATARERAVAEGRLRPGTGGLVLPRPAPAPQGTRAVLDELRSDR